MSYIKLFFLVLMAAFYIFAGLSHFKNPRFFLSITPKWVPSPDKVNKIIGIMEITFGIAVLIPSTRSFAAIGIIALLVLVFPANLYHHQKARAKGKHIIPTLIRLPLQLLLIYWAYMYI